MLFEGDDCWSVRGKCGITVTPLSITARQGQREAESPAGSNVYFPSLASLLPRFSPHVSAMPPERSWLYLPLSTFPRAYTHAYTRVPLLFLLSSSLFTLGNGPS